MSCKPSAPPTASDKLLDLKIAQLGMIQSAIGRMSSYSANAKNYCTTILAAVVALAAQNGSARLFLGAVIATIFFGAIDLYYLTLEVRFREAYGDAANTLYDADLSVRPTKGNRKHAFKAARSASIVLFYGPILAACATVWILIPAPRASVPTSAYDKTGGPPRAVRPSLCAPKQNGCQPR